MAKKIKAPKSYRDLPQSVITQMFSLTASGFGLVAALAWNEVIQELVATYIKPYLPESAGLISLLIYAITVTLLAVLVTLQFSRIQSKLRRK